MAKTREPFKTIQQILPRTPPQTEPLKEGDKILIEATILRVAEHQADTQGDLLRIQFPDCMNLPAGQSHIYVRRRACRPFTEKE